MFVSVFFLPATVKCLRTREQQGIHNFTVFITLTANYMHGGVQNYHKFRWILEMINFNVCIVSCHAAISCPQLDSQLLSLFV